MSIKSSKGSPFERDVAYSLKEGGFNVEILGDNTKGIDIIAENSLDTYCIECKFHKGFSWNELVKIFKKTEATVSKTSVDSIPLVVFKANQQPVLVMHYDNGIIKVAEFDRYFTGCYWHKRPVGYKLWSINKGTK